MFRFIGYILAFSKKEEKKALKASVKNLIQRFSQGSVPLYRGNYKTEEDISVMKKKILKYTF